LAPLPIVLISVTRIGRRTGVHVVEHPQTSAQRRSAESVLDPVGDLVQTTLPLGIRFRKQGPLYRLTPLQTAHT